MKPIYSLAMAAVATLILLALAFVDPEFTFSEALKLAVIIWWILMIQVVVQRLVNRKPKSHEKTSNPVSPHVP